MGSPLGVPIWTADDMLPGVTTDIMILPCILSFFPLLVNVCTDAPCQIYVRGSTLH